MKRLHVVPGLDAIGNGMSVAAHLIADAVGDDLIEALQFASGNGDINSYDEIWVHSCWLPSVLRSCRRVLKSSKTLVCMPHGNLDPVRLRYHAWKKVLVGPIERFFLRRCVKIVATCEAEKGWIQSYLGKHCPPVIVTDIKRFFKLGNWERIPRAKRVAEGDALAGVGTGNIGKTGQTCFPNDRPLHLLYLGRRHPLKGLSYLESALTTYYNMLSKPQIVSVPSDQTSATYYNKCPVEFRVISNAFGEELEKVWDWCDVLVLPTLSDNFGLVIAEALERGKRVITTDGAPAWGPEECGNMEMLQISNSNIQSGSGIWEGYGGRLVYLKGYRDGTPEVRVHLLKSAIDSLSSHS